MCVFGAATPPIEICARKRKRPEDEREVGIREYVSDDIPALGGRLKAQPEDFVVIELDVDGVEAGGVVRDNESIKSDHISCVGGGSSASSSSSETTPSSDITQFVLKKRCMDTLGAVAILAERLALPARIWLQGSRTIVQSRHSQ